MKNRQLLIQGRRERSGKASRASENLLQRARVRGQACSIQRMTNRVPWRADDYVVIHEDGCATVVRFTPGGAVVSYFKSDDSYERSELLKDRGLASTTPSSSRQSPAPDFL